jgi:aspartyl-tRNA synthetase
LRESPSRLGLKAGDACFFVAGDPDKFYKFAGSARTKVGSELGLIDEERLRARLDRRLPDVRVQRGREEGRLLAQPVLDAAGRPGVAAGTHDPLAIKAFQYDIACNGYEIASGGIRNHRPEAMVKAFEIAGYGEETVIERFGGMYRAFQYGAPPHGGMAAGVDRIIMLLCGATNLREVALFPMNQQAVDLLMGAPSPATPKQLREAHLRVNLPEKEG